MPDTTTGGASSPAATVTAKEPEKNTGIVAIDSGEHAEAKTVFQTLKDKASALEVDLKEELDKLKALLHL